MRYFQAVSWICSFIAVGAAVAVSRMHVDTSSLPSKFAFADLDMSDVGAAVPDDSAAKAFETYARPLFAVNRRPDQSKDESSQDDTLSVEPPPPVMTEDTTPSVPIEEPPLKLLGTDPLRKKASALIAMDETGASHWFHKGEVVNGWLITEIGPNDIEVASEVDAQVNFRLPLYPDK